MLNIQNIFKLCDRYIINIDRFNNNLLKNDMSISNSYISISVNSDFCFRFKIIPQQNNRVKIMCLNSFKYLTCDENNMVYFIDYGMCDNVNTLFYCVYDDINLCLFPIKNSNLILCYVDNGLCFKDVENEGFEVEDQTIFLYEQISYDNIVYLSSNNHNNLQIEYYNINTILDVFKFICGNYYKDTNLLISLTNYDFDTEIPINFFIDFLPTILDRMINLENLNIYKRIINHKSLTDIELFSYNTKLDYFDNNSQNVDNLIPKIENIKIIWSQILNIETLPKNIYFNSNGIYYVSMNTIRLKPINYYNNILLLLNKKNSDKLIYNLIQFSLYYILYNEY